MSSKTKILFVVASITLGALITLASVFYNHITQKQHCSDIPAMNNVIDCNLQFDNRGLPFAYVVTDLPNDDFRVPAFVADAAIWSIVSGLLIYGVGYGVRRLKA